MENNIHKNLPISSEQDKNPLDSMINSHYTNQDSFKQKPFGKSIFTLFFAGLAVWFMDSIQVIVIALGVFIIFHIFIISPHTIEGPSMEPNFCNGDLVLADKLSPRFNPYKVGDVIIFKKNEQDDYIKRIIGVGGDTIKVEGGLVYRNNSKIDETYLPSDRQTKIYPGFSMIEGKTYTVPKGEYLVFGDNREHSTDSRSFLYINPSENTIKGRIIVLIWPIKDFRVFDSTISRPEKACSVL